MKLKLENLQEYVQKSRMFALPLLQISKNPAVIETYFGIVGLNLSSGYSLVLLYHNEHPSYAAHLVQLENNKFFDFVVTDAEFDIVVFDLSSIKDDYLKIINGQYSKLSKNAKILIKLANTDEKASMGINPEYYYKDLAEILQYPEEAFENTEIISLPDMDNEMLNVKQELFIELTEQYLIPTTD